jgi:hypothetical protein
LRLERESTSDAGNFHCYPLEDSKLGAEGMTGEKNLPFSGNWHSGVNIATNLNPIEQSGHAQRIFIAQPFILR